MKNTYYNFKIGDNVILNNSVVSEGLHFDTGHNFKIISFPYCSIVCKYQNFVFGKDDKGNIIRCFVNEILKIK
jgi:hypothetical protein